MSSAEALDHFTNKLIERARLWDWNGEGETPSRQPAGRRRYNGLDAGRKK